ncbi:MULTISPECIES: MerR family transcriptional regulator [unclassified Rhizobium]|uniref:MerR family transcriptional regulator n=1 Tax=unclassified Rhizobium TaxID=2613769 RepID=UPI0021F6F4B9|nr:MULTISPECIES: MerR family transcriptional regulator [unclassified Rhizobium]MCV9946753.1 MerR family transcriptional regulator [Rhizobium sp. BT-175]MCW0020608.1 MerR family transcriptional regulator [Rhizobium sp. BT-226]
MNERMNENLWLTAAECAERIGLTVKALRLYEKRGLINPRRTGKNWRLYGIEDIARLNEILALKRLGLSLARITELLAGQATDLDRTLSMQQTQLLSLRSRVEDSLSRINALRQRIAAGEPISLNELVSIAKETSMTDQSADAAAWRRYEQARPRTEGTIAPELNDDYLGAYLFEWGGSITIARREGGLTAQVLGQEAIDIYPEKEDEFFYRVVTAQIGFRRGPDGRVDGLVLRQNGWEQEASRIDAAAAARLVADLENRTKNKQPVDNSEALLRSLIAQHQSGEVDYDRMVPALADAGREQMPMIRADLERAGTLRSISFKGVSSEGWDVYDVAFENAAMEWRFVLAADGRFSGIFFRRLS